MPYKSEKQKRLMQGVAHNPAFAATMGIPQAVGQKFEREERGHEKEEKARWEASRTGARAHALRRRPGATKY